MGVLAGKERRVESETRVFVPWAGLPFTFDRTQLLFPSMSMLFQPRDGNTLHHSCCGHPGGSLLSDTPCKEFLKLLSGCAICFPQDPQEYKHLSVKQISGIYSSVLYKNYFIKPHFISLWLLLQQLQMVLQQTFVRTGPLCPYLFSSFFHFYFLGQNLLSLLEDYLPVARIPLPVYRKNQVPRNLPTTTLTQQCLINDWWHGCVNISAPSSLMGTNLRWYIPCLQIYPAGLSHSYSPWHLTWYL